MGFYKFLRSADVPRVLADETIVISSFQFFRELEREGIGDYLEGATELKMPEQFSITEGSSNLEILNNANIGLGICKQFAQVSSGGRIEMGNATFVQQLPQMHIYSFSFGALEDLKCVMCADQEDPYDACLEIIDPRILLQAIVLQGVIADTGEPAQAVFKQNVGGEVTYTEVSRNILDGPFILPDPFNKARQFSSQREHRFIFDTSGKELPSRLVVKIPNLARHLKRIF